MKFKFLLATAALLSAGCGGTETTGSTLTGKVLINGEPARGGLIHFIPQGGSSSSAGSPIAEDGSYSARMSRSLEGIEPGEYIVGFEVYQIEPGGTVDGRLYPEGVPGVPASIASGDNPIRITVAPNTDMEEDFNLEGDVPDIATAKSVPDPDAGA